MIRFMLVLVGVGVGLAPAAAGPVFATPLSGGQEVPPRATPASGYGFIEFNDALTAVRAYLTVSNIQNVVDAHIHLGAAGTNGPVVLGFGPFSSLDIPGSAVLVDRTFTAANLSGPLAPPPAGTGTIAALYQAALAGNLYFNVHTNDGVAPTNTGPGDFPGGEVRGQLALQVPEPASLIVFGVAGAAAVGAWRRRKAG